MMSTLLAGGVVMSITGPGSITAANIAGADQYDEPAQHAGQELGTGQAAQTYSGLQDRRPGWRCRLTRQLAAINGYSATAQTVGTTLTVAQSVLSQLDSARSSVQQDDW